MTDLAVCVKSIDAEIEVARETTRPSVCGSAAA